MGGIDAECFVGGRRDHSLGLGRVNVQVLGWGGADVNEVVGGWGILSVDDGRDNNEDEDDRRRQESEELHD